MTIRDFRQPHMCSVIRAAEDDDRRRASSRVCVPTTCCDNFVCLLSS